MTTAPETAALRFPKDYLHLAFPLGTFILTIYNKDKNGTRHNGAFIPYALWLPCLMIGVVALRMFKLRPNQTQCRMLRSYGNIVLAGLGAAFASKMWIGRLRWVEEENLDMWIAVLGCASSFAGAVWSTIYWTRQIQIRIDEAGTSGLLSLADRCKGLADLMQAVEARETHIEEIEEKKPLAEEGV